MNAITDLSPALLAAIGALVAVQLVLQVAALVSLARTPASQLTLGGRKWAWAIVIVVGELIGAIVYFAVGRLPAPARDLPAAAPAPGRAQAAADTLYGSSSATSADAGETGAPDAGDAATPAAAEVGADGTGMGELP